MYTSNRPSEDSTMLCREYPLSTIPSNKNKLIDRYGTILLSNATCYIMYITTIDDFGVGGKLLFGYAPNSLSILADTFFLYDHIESITVYEE